MTNSVNTNPAAYVALASLRTTQTNLDSASKQVQTGYRVADAADDASTFSVAQGVRANLQAYTSVQGSLANGAGLGAVTQAALANVSDLVGNLQSKVTQLADGAISANQRAIYTNDFNAITSQVSNFISQANYNGSNLLSAGSTDKTYLSDTNGTSLALSAQSAVDGAFSTFTSAASVASASGASAALGALSTFQQAVATSLGANAAESRSLTLQSNFINAVVDTVATGLGASVDADIGKAAAAVQAQQVRQQLGVQSLSIANEQPSALLSLFR
jgi:flagellin